MSPHHGWMLLPLLLEPFLLQTKKKKTVLRVKIIPDIEIIYPPVRQRKSHREKKICENHITEDDLGEELWFINANLKSPNKFTGAGTITS